MHSELKKNSSKQKHEFAFFCSQLPHDLQSGAIYKVTDQDIIHRMMHVVRVQEGDTAILFERYVAATVRVDAMVKNGVTCTIIGVEPVKPLAPVVTWYLPLLDRAAFEESISILTSMGAFEITPIITEKSDSRLRAHERLERVMIAAAEQSKQFALPVINPAMRLSESGACTHADRVTTIFFDPAGEPAYEVMTRVRAGGTAPLACIVGPEGDLTDNEKELLRERGVIFCALTPTVLRAEQAVTVAMGLVRSCGNSLRSP